MTETSLTAGSCRTPSLPVGRVYIVFVPWRNLHMGRRVRPLDGRGGSETAVFLPCRAAVFLRIVALARPTSALSVLASTALPGSVSRRPGTYSAHSAASGIRPSARRPNTPSHPLPEWHLCNLHPGDPTVVWGVSFPDPPHLHRIATYRCSHPSCAASALAFVLIAAQRQKQRRSKHARLSLSASSSLLLLSFLCYIFRSLPPGSEWCGGDSRREKENLNPPKRINK